MDIINGYKKKDKKGVSYCRMGDSCSNEYSLKKLRPKLLYNLRLRNEKEVIQLLITENLLDKLLLF